MWCWEEGRGDKRREGKKEEWGSGERREGEKIETVCGGRIMRVERAKSRISYWEKRTVY